MENVLKKQEEDQLALESMKEMMGQVEDVEAEVVVIRADLL